MWPEFIPSRWINPTLSSKDEFILTYPGESNAFIEVSLTQPIMHCQDEANSTNPNETNLTRSVQFIPRQPLR